MAVILATNDDGINALGLRVLVKELARKGHKVYVAAPECQRSGASKSVFFKAAFKNTELEGAVQAWTVKAPPASIVYIAVKKLLPEKPDLIVSGLNHGPNMGFEDFFTSGTIGAAIEANLMGIPAIAGSIAERTITSEEKARIPAIITSEAASAMLDLLSSEWREALPLLIINSPLEPKGVLVTRMAWNTYRVELEYLGEDVLAPRMSFDSIYDVNAPEGTDIWAVLNGYASITLVDLRKLYRTLSNIEEENVSFLERIAERMKEAFMRERA